MARFYIALIVIALYFSGCAQIAEFTLRDAQAARARAARNLDEAGARCWTYVEKKLVDNADDLEVVGIMDAIELARIARLKAPALRKEAADGCGDVFADVLIELAKRGAKRGF